ncbi:hypothetical protein OPV22_007389 [Ensete ventricosum]|uniref:Arginase 1, mitochondrial n=1 Tax=Ensete ventricosum TaxID=4639 RepID=A0AAV8RUF4_ENSVE|nr:hypothetical protein OPV22_007389 [Ensete ventricosum]
MNTGGGFWEQTRPFSVLADNFPVHFAASLSYSATSGKQPDEHPYWASSPPSQFLVSDIQSLFQRVDPSAPEQIHWFAPSQLPPSSSLPSRKMSQGTRWMHYLKQLSAANVPAALIENGQNRVIDASLTLIRERAKLKGEFLRSLGGVKASTSLLGVPLGHNSSFLQGPAFAPPRIREAIWCGSTNSTTEEGKELNDPRVLTDVGDVPIQEIRDCGVDDDRLMNIISDSVKLVMEEDPLRPLVLGGDHSISFPVVRAVSEKLGGPLDILHLDAHPDIYDAFEGNKYSHASSFARIMEGGYARRLLQVGIRSITREGREQGKRFGVEQYEMRTFSRDRQILENLKLGEGVKGVYISVDVDCLDPAFAPGVSHIEPGGLSFRDVLNILHNLQADVVAADVVEFNPQRDTVDGMTAMVAAKLTGSHTRVNEANCFDGVANSLMVGRSSQCQPRGTVKVRHPSSKSSYSLICSLPHNCTALWRTASVSDNHRFHLQLGLGLRRFTECHTKELVEVLFGALDWVSVAFDAPLARAVVFGVHIDGHLVVEVLLVAVILFQLTRKSYKPPKKPLSEKEIDDLCEEWVPEPLHPSISEDMKAEPPTLESAAGPHTIIDGKEVVNFASANYLGLIGNEKIIDSCVSSLEKYGVGSCGPRGFYGTIDVHLDCEERIAKFMGTPDSILYSYGISTIFSVIPAFCKKGDIIVVDEGVHWGVQNGLHLSRSTIVYFKHNDMKSLENTLEKLTRGNKQAEKIRRYIVVEAVYQNSGQIAPLDEIVQLKEKYRFRVILDESHSFGVLGNSGRGLAEYYGVPVDKIDIITAGMGNALATDGGFCTGSVRVVDHQRLSSSGYVFSASLPPYLASAAISAVNYLEDNPSVLTSLRSNIALLWKGLSDVPGLTIASHPLSPIVFLKLKKSTGSSKGDLELLNNVADRMLKEDSVFIVSTKRSVLDKCRLPVGIRLFVSAGHSESDIQKVSDSLKRVAATTLAEHL